MNLITLMSMQKFYWSHAEQEKKQICLKWPSFHKFNKELNE